MLFTRLSLSPDTHTIQLYKLFGSEYEVVLTCTMLNQVLNDFKVSIEASGSQRGRVGLRRRVDVRAAIRQQLHDLQVSGGRGTPERWCSLDGFTIKCD